MGVSICLSSGSLNYFMQPIYLKNMIFLNISLEYFYMHQCSVPFHSCIILVRLIDLTSGRAPAGARAQTPAGRGLRRRPPPSAAHVLAARPPFFLSFCPFLSVMFACSFPSNRSKTLMLLLNQSNIFTVEPRRKEGVCIEGSFILSFNRLQIRLFIHYILLE